MAWLAHERKYLEQDPNARNCHGYRKFVKRNVLENQQNGYLVDDTIIIRYTIELVVSSGGALSRAAGAAAVPKPPSIQVCPMCMGVAGHWVQESSCVPEQGLETL